MRRRNSQRASRSAASPVRRAAGPLAHALDPASSRLLPNEGDGRRRRRTGAVVERRNRQPLALDNLGRRIQQRHRIDAAGNGEDDPIPAPKGSVDRVAQLPDLSGAHVHKVSPLERRNSDVQRAGTKACSRMGQRGLPLRKGCRLYFRSFAFGVRDLSTRSTRLETHGPLGTLWVSIGLGCFYIALIWLNTLLGFFLTPLFIIPATWVMDRLGKGAPADSRP